MWGRKTEKQQQQQQPVEREEKKNGEYIDGNIIRFLSCVCSITYYIKLIDIE